MKIYTFDKKKHYLSNDLFAEYPDIFEQFKSTRSFVRDNKLTEGTEYVFCRKNAKGVFQKSSGTSNNLDKVFITKKWSDEYVSENSTGLEEEFPPLPPTIKLTKKESFHSFNGKVLKIHTVGSREFESTYFKCKDIETQFPIKRLCDLVLDRRYNGYTPDEEFVFFDDNGKKVLYLTYMGVLRALIACRQRSSVNFVRWATETLFTAQMGTTVQKQNLAAKLIGTSPACVKAVFDTSARAVPGNYLFTLGLVKDLRKIFKVSDRYKDTDTMYKFGKTDNIRNRTGEHEADFGKLGISINLACYVEVDPQFISKSETEIKHFFKTSKMHLDDNPEYTELVIFPDKDLKGVKSFYSTIGKAYSGHISEKICQIKERDTEISLLKEQHAREKAEMTSAHLKEVSELNDRLAKCEKLLAKKEGELALIEKTDKIKQLEDKIMSMKPQVSKKKISSGSKTSEVKKKISSGSKTSVKKKPKK